jgi:hypothetical protein
MLQFLQLFIQVSLEELKGSDALCFIFHRFALKVVLKFFKELGQFEECTVTGSVRNYYPNSLVLYG